MKNVHREQPMVADVEFVPVYDQIGVTYRGMEGGEVAPECLPVDTMEGLQVNDRIPEGFYAEAAASEDGSDDESNPDEGEVVTDKTLSEGGAVTLANDVQAENAIQIENGVKTEVNLGGKTITAGLFAESNGSVAEGSSDSYAFWVKEGGELVIEGDGQVVAQEATYSMAVWAQGGTVIISGGTFTNGGDGCDLIYASAGGKVYIYGGEFKATAYKGTEPGTQNPYSALNIKNSDRETSDIVVYGGRFYGFDPANNLSEPNPSEEWLAKHPNGFVAEGYKSVEVEEGVWEVVAA